MGKRIVTIIFIGIAGVLAGVSVMVGITVAVQNAMNPFSSQMSQILENQQLIKEQLKGNAPIVQAAAPRVPAAKQPAPAPAQEAVAAKKHDIPIGNSMVKGNKKAPITLVEFTDFECPFCARFHPVVEEVLKEFPKDVKAVLKNFPLGFHKNAKPAAKATLAAGDQGKYWEMVDAVLKNGKQLSDEKYVELAKEIGLNVGKFQKALKNNDAKYEQQIKDDMDLAQKVGVRGTPTFFIGGYQTRSRDLDSYKKEIALIKEGKPIMVPKPPARPPAPDLNKVHDIDIGKSHVKGQKNAKVTIVEFSDLECPFSARFHPVLEEVVKAYPKDVKVVFKNFPLGFHKNAKPAAKATMAAGEQGKYWEMVDIVLKNGKQLGSEKYEEFAKEIGLNVDKFKKDLASKDAEYEQIIKDDMGLASKVGVRGTPTFFLNGKLTRSRDLESYKKEIDEILGKK